MITSISNNRIPVVIFFIFLLLWSCKSNVSKAATETQIKALQELITDRNFTITSDVAYPRATNAMMNLQNSGIYGTGNTANRISLIGNSNYLTIKGDSVWSELPYYGERQMAAAYDPNDIGIKLNSVITFYEAEWNESKQMYVVRLKGKSDNEGFDIVINMFPNMSCRMTLTGSKRFPIGYAGRVIDTLSSDY